MRLLRRKCGPEWDGSAEMQGKNISHMNFLLILIIAIILVAAIMGVRKGLFGILFGLFAWGFVLLAVIFGSPRMQVWLEANTDVYQKIYASADSYVVTKLTTTSSRPLSELTQDEKDEKTGPDVASDAAGIPSGARDEDDASTPFIADLINKLVSDVTNSKNAAASAASESTGAGTADSALPPALTRSLRGTAQEAVDSYGSAAADAVETAKGTVIDAVADAVAKRIADYALVCLARVAVLALAGIVVLLVALIIRIVEMNKGIRTQSHVLGFFFGVLQGLLISWVLLFFLSCIGTTAAGQTLAADINSSAFLTWLYNNNVVADLILQLVKA